MNQITRCYYDFPARPQINNDETRNEMKTKIRATLYAQNTLVTQQIDSRHTKQLVNAICSSSLSFFGNKINQIRQTFQRQRLFSPFFFSVFFYVQQQLHCGRSEFLFGFVFIFHSISILLCFYFALVVSQSYIILKFEKFLPIQHQ